VLLVTANTDVGPMGGVLTPDGSIASLAGWGYGSVEALIEGGSDSWARVAAAAGEAAVTWPPEQPLYSPILRTPRNIMCAGLNYVEHHKEGHGATTPLAPHPVVFTKPWTTLLGPTDDLRIDRSATEKVDWEAEVAVVIGVGGSNISELDAEEHIFGYCLANDVSARDIQLENGAGSQWFKGKSLDNFCPLGPAIVTGLSLAELATFRVELTVNGVTKQDFIVGDMYHSIPKLISYLSAGMALLPGDVILTGTAAGVGIWREPPEFLRDGDVVEVTCTGLGALRNKIVD
jgi:2,4-diketo-3-deoxy-L-fuconate hydrolase